MSCTKAQGFLADSGIEPKEVLSASAKLGDSDALRLVAAASTVVVARGKRVTTFDMRKQRPDDDTLLSHMLGPTGNLRAPALRSGKTLLIGFSDDVYRRVLA